MASRRELKKDINYLTYEVISDCYTYMILNSGKNEDQVLSIITDTVETRNDLIHRVNNQEEKGNRKAVKLHYRGIFDDLLGKIDNSFERLSKLTK